MLAVFVALLVLLDVSTCNDLRCYTNTKETVTNEDLTECLEYQNSCMIRYNKDLKYYHRECTTLSSRDTLGCKSFTDNNGFVITTCHCDEDDCNENVDDMMKNNDNDEDEKQKQKLSSSAGSSTSRLGSSASNNNNDDDEKQKLSSSARSSTSRLGASVSNGNDDDNDGRGDSSSDDEENKNDDGSDDGDSNNDDDKTSDKDENVIKFRADEDEKKVVDVTKDSIHAEIEDFRDTLEKLYMAKSDEKNEFVEELVSFFNDENAEFCLYSECTRNIKEVMSHDQVYDDVDIDFNKVKISEYGNTYFSYISYVTYQTINDCSGFVNGKMYFHFDKNGLITKWLIVEHDSNDIEKCF